MEANRPTIRLLKDYPAILLEWDFEKNEATPQTLKSGSTIYAWWAGNQTDSECSTSS